MDGFSVMEILFPFFFFAVFLDYNARKLFFAEQLFDGRIGNDFDIFRFFDLFAKLLFAREIRQILDNNYLFCDPRKQNCLL